MPKFQVGDVVRIVAHSNNIKLRGQVKEHPIGAIRTIGWVYDYLTIMHTTYSVNEWDGDRKISGAYNFTVNDSMLELAAPRKSLKEFM
jgi:hypothetical protein